MTSLRVNPFPHKPATLLKWLLAGQIVEFKGLRWCLTDDKRLGTIGYRQTLGDPTEPTEVVLINDLPLSEFIKLADSIPDDDMFILGAEMALTDINRGNF